MKVRNVLVAIVALCVVIQPALADLIVLRPGGATRSALLHFRERNAQLLATLSADTEGFYGVCFAPDGQIYATGNTLGYGEVYRFTPAGELLGRFAGANLRAPGNLTFGPDGHLYVIGTTWPESPERGQILRYDGSTGAFIDYFVLPGSGGAARLTDLAFGRDGHLYVADSGQGILRYDGTTGAFLDIFIPLGRAGLASPSAFVFGLDGHLYVCSRDSDSVLKFNRSSGALLKVIVPSGKGGLRSPAGLAFGRRGSLYVSSSASNRVLRYNARTGQLLGAFITAHPEVINPGRLISFPRARSAHAQRVRPNRR